MRDYIVCKHSLHYIYPVDRSQAHNGCLLLSLLGAASRKCYGFAAAERAEVHDQDRSAETKRWSVRAYIETLTGPRKSSKMSWLHAIYRESCGWNSAINVRDDGSPAEHIPHPRACVIAHQSTPARVQTREVRSPPNPSHHSFLRRKSVSGNVVASIFNNQEAIATPVSLLPVLAL